MDKETPEESLLSRWSRRKSESRSGDVSDEVEMPVTDEALDVSSQPLQEAEEPEPPLLTDADMPELDSLNSESDFSMFMSKGVSDKLRNMALRKMFAAPVFNIRDGLDEYDEDYTYFEKLGDIVTCDMKHQIEMQEKKRLEKLADAEAEAARAEEAGLDEIEPDESEELDSDEEFEEIVDVDDPDQDSILRNDQADPDSLGKNLDKSVSTK